MLESGLVLIVIVAARIDRSHNDICRLFAICMPNDLLVQYQTIRQSDRRKKNGERVLRNYETPHMIDKNDKYISCTSSEHTTYVLIEKLKKR